MTFTGGGGGVVTSDFNWGAEETLLLVSLYFLGSSIDDGITENI